MAIQRVMSESTRAGSETIHAAHYPTIDSPSTSLDDASILLSMESQLSSLYAERTQLHAALGVSDAEEVIALVAELRAKAEMPQPTWSSVAEPAVSKPGEQLTPELETRISGARRTVAELLAAQREVERIASTIDTDIAALDTQRDDLEARLARVASKRAELEARRSTLASERMDLADRLDEIESVMARLEALAPSTSPEPAPLLSDSWMTQSVGGIR